MLPGAVLEIAPPNVLQGAVRVHGLRSSPVPDTQVRTCCARAGAAPRSKASIAATEERTNANFGMTSSPLLFEWSRFGRRAAAVALDRVVAERDQPAPVLRSQSFRIVGPAASRSGTRDRPAVT